MSLTKDAITRVQAIIIAAIVVVAAVGVTYYYYFSTSTPTTIKIGVPLPLTGAAAKIGNEILDGMRLAVEEINEKGGVLGKRLELVISDSMGEVEKELAACKKMVEVDKVNIMSGILGQYREPLDYLDEVGIPFIGPTTPLVMVITEDFPGTWDNLFCFAYTDRAVAKSVISFVKDVVKGKTLVIVNEEFGAAFARLERMIREFAKEEGIEVLATITYPIGCKDFTDVLIKLEELKPDAIYLFVVTGAEATFFKQRFERGLKIPTYTTGALPTSSEFPQIVGVEVANYHVIGTWGYNLSITEKTIPFCRKFYEKYGYYPFSHETAAGYDCVYFIAAVIEKAGSLDWNAILKAIPETEIIGVRGRLRINMKNHAPAWFEEMGDGYPRYYFIRQWINGKVYVVWPPEYAEKTFEKPR
jgi:branched-chain amino acid transport system substrate-binding protein